MKSNYIGLLRIFFLALNYLLSIEGVNSQSCNSFTPILTDPPNPLITGNCNAPDPEPYMTICAAGIQRYLARAINLDGFAELNAQMACWSHPTSNGSNAPNLNCDPPYSTCSSTYCPAKYRQTIEMLLELNATMLLRSASFWFKEDQWEPEINGDLKPYYVAVRQLVCDVNKSYDCAGIRRPYIQAGIFEGCTNNVEQVTIPAEYFQPGFLNGYFWNEFTTADLPVPPSTTRKFRHSKIVGPDGDVDISQVEARMWFYFQATQFIDLGYNALHMGNPSAWGDKNGSPGQAPYTIAFELIQHIRNYAGNGILINGEGNDYTIEINGVRTMLFDFGTIPLRPHEVASGPQGQIPADGGCDTPYNSQMFDGTPCENASYPAFIYKCQMEQQFAAGLPSSGGISPQGCDFSEGAPYLMYFDFGPGFHCPNNNFTPYESGYYDWNTDRVYCCNNPQGCFNSNGQPCLNSLCCDPTQNANYVSTWGFDDNRWFYEMYRESPECATYWLKEFYCSVRQLHEGLGFMQLPGIMFLSFPENESNLCDNVDDSPVGTGRFLLSDDQDMVDELADQLAPKLAGLSITEYCTAPNKCNFICRDIPAPGGKRWAVGKNYYVIEATNKDCSSSYSIHIRNLNTGQWMPYENSDRYVFFPPEDGYYEVILRQDNMALEEIVPGSFGTVNVMNSLNLYSYCCKGPYSPLDCILRVWGEFQCVGEDVEKITYEFELGKISATPAAILNVSSVFEDCQVSEVEYLSDGRARGFVHVYNKQNPQFNVLVDYSEAGTIEKVFIEENLTQCGQVLQYRSTPKTILEPQLSGLSIFPNPSTEFVNLYYQSLSSEMAEIRIFDALGTHTIAQNANITLGENVINVNTELLPSGQYYLVLITENIMSYGKFIRQ